MSQNQADAAERTYLAKADLEIGEISAGGGVLNEAKANTFIKEMVQKSELLPRITVYGMRAPKQSIPRVALNGRFLRPGTPGTGLNNEADRTKPSFAQETLDAKLFRGRIQMTDEDLEDNIEQKRFVSTLLSMAQDSAALDLEDLVINGDKTGATDTDGTGYLKQVDGALVQANMHVVDAGGLRISRTILASMHRALPKAWRRMKSRMVFMTSYNAEQDFRLLFSDRETETAERMNADGGQVRHHGTEIVPIGLFPDDQGVGEDNTSILLCMPKNIILGIWRKIKFERTRDPLNGMNYWIVTMRVDVAYADPNGVVKAENVLNQGFA